MSGKPEVEFAVSLRLTGIRYFDTLAEDPRVWREGLISRPNLKENDAREKQGVPGKGH